MRATNLVLAVLPLLASGTTLSVATPNAVLASPMLLNQDPTDTGDYFESTAADADMDIPTADEITAAEEAPHQTPAEVAAAQEQYDALAAAEGQSLADGIEDLNAHVAYLSDQLQVMAVRLEEQQVALSHYTEVAEQAMQTLTAKASQPPGPAAAKDEEDQP